MDTETLAEDVPRRGGSLQVDLSIHMRRPLRRGSWRSRRAMATWSGI